MRWKFGLASSLLFFSAAWGQKRDCKSEFVAQGPFEVTSVTDVKVERFFGSGGVVRDASGGDRISVENFRNERTDQKPKLVPRGTIVQIFGEPDVQSELAKSIRKGEGVFVPVKVMTTNDTYKQFKPKEDQDRHVADGDLGYIWSRSLKSAANFEYRVTKPTVLLQLRTGASVNVPPGATLEPVTNDAGQFEVEQCKDPTSGKTTTAYVFVVRLYDPKTKGAGSVRLGLPDSCTLDGLRPMPPGMTESLESLSGVIKEKFGEDWGLDRFDTNDFGFVRLPLEVIGKDGADIRGVGPKQSYFHHQGNDPLNSDTWGKPYAICTFVKFADAWKKQCKGVGCDLRVGDVAFVTPGLTAEPKDPLGHKSHHEGDCFDIRPFRNDDSLEGTEIGKAEYSQARTKEFLTLAKEWGANPTYFDDKETGGTPSPGHSNHLHICFDEKAAKKQGCAE